jgi:hypothetical protein
MDQLDHALSGAAVGAALPARHVRVYSCCEIDPKPRSLLLNRCRGHIPEHVFGDVLDRVAPKYLAILKKIEAKYLQQSRAGGTTDKQKARLGKRMLSDMIAVLETAEFLSTAECYKHGRQCPLVPDLRPGELHVDASGTTCVAWSNMRKGSSHHGKWLHTSTLPFLVWMYWIKLTRPDLFVHECVARFDSAVFEETLDAYTLLPLVFAPVDLGVPAHRRRKYTIGWDTAKRLLGHVRDDGTSSGQRVSWVQHNGEKDTDESKLQARLDWTAEFKSMFFAKPASSASIYLQATDEMVLDFANAALTLRGITPRPGLRQEVALRGAEFQRMLGYRAAIRTKIFLKGLRTDCIIVDLQQTSGYVGCGSPWAPTLLTRSALFSFDCSSRSSMSSGRSRLLLPWEYFAIHSFPICLATLLEQHPDTADDADDGNSRSVLQKLHLVHFPWNRDDFQAFDSLGIQMMVGNSMNITAVGTVLLMALSLCGDVLPPALEPSKVVPRAARKRPAAALS